MAQVTAQLIKELRERTQAGMSDCKASLVEADGDMEKAIEIILKKGLVKSTKRASAAATEGEVRAQVFGDGKSGVIVEVNSQTDFVARNDAFIAFVGSVIDLAKATPAGSDLLAQTTPSGKTLEEARAEITASIGENIQVRRWERFDVKEEGFVTSYVHMGGKIGVLIEFKTSSGDIAARPEVRTFAEETAMQIAAMSAQYVDKTQVPADAIAKQVTIFEGQLQEEGKPEKAWPKIIEGKKAKWFTDVCLVDQESVLVPGSSVEKLRAELSKTVGGEVSIVRFARFERGEGIVKKTDDFAAEVAKMAGS
jgi:elongation factor Ts